MSLGTVFSTGNEVVNTLPVGSVLEVVGQGELQVVDVPEVALQEGDRIRDGKGRYGTVLRMTTKGRRNDQFPDEGEVLYISDGTFIVRVAEASSLTKV